jgi:hypothetical protein
MGVGACMRSREVMLPGYSEGFCTGCDKDILTLSQGASHDSSIGHGTVWPCKGENDGSVKKCAHLLSDWCAGSKEGSKELMDKSGRLCLVQRYNLQG